LTIIAGISEQNFRNDRILICRRFCKFCSDTDKNQSGQGVIGGTVSKTGIADRKQLILGFNG